MRKKIISGTKNELLKYPKTKQKTVHHDDENEPIHPGLKAKTGWPEDSRRFYF